MRRDPSFGEIQKSSQVSNFADLGIINNNFLSESDARKAQEYRKLQMSFLNNRIKKRSEIMKKKNDSSPLKGIKALKN